MQTLFNKSPNSSRGVVIPGLWTQARSGLNRNLQQAVSYYQSRLIATRSNHLISKLLNNLRVSLDSPTERYYELIDAVAPSVGMGLRLTNEVHRGDVHDGVFYGPGTREVIIGHTEPFDLYECERNWKNAAPVRILDHNKSDLDIHIPNGVSYSKEAGYAVIAINIPQLAVMWRCFLKEQRAVMQRGGSPKTTPMFVHCYVLANALPSHLDIALINRLIRHVSKAKPGQPTRRNPFTLSDYTHQTDTVLTQVIDHLQNADLSMHDMLCNIPLVTAINAAEAMQLPTVAPTRQYAWSEVVARVKVIAAMAALSPRQLKTYDKFELTYMSRMIDYGDVRPVIASQMKTDSAEIFNLLDLIQSIASSS